MDGHDDTNESRGGAAGSESRTVTRDQACNKGRTRSMPMQGGSAMRIIGQKKRGPDGVCRLS
jgi:hypothetical protein